MIVNKRNSNIELLRIIAMLLIIAGHFIDQSEILEIYSINSGDRIFLSLIGSGSRIAVNIFLIIGTWFMVDSNFKAKNVLKIYGQVVFFTVPITLIVVILGYSNSVKDTLRGFMPFLGRPLWFASAYMTLLVVSPFLKKIIRWDFKSLKAFVIVMFIAISLISTLPDRQESYVLDCCWFMYVYIFVGFIKRTNFLEKFKKYKFLILIIALGIYITLVFGNLICDFFVDKYSALSNVKTIISQYLSDIKTIPNFICAFAIFYYFITLENKNNKIIDFISTTSFGVYIFHQVPVFINVLWKNIFLCDKWNNSKFITLYTCLVILGVYAIASVIDIIRKKFFERKFLDNKISCYICEKIDTFLTIN